MKIKLLFTLLIVLLLSCSQKTLVANDYSYYKQEIEKSKRQEKQKKQPTYAVTKSDDAAVKQGFLSQEKRAEFAKMLEVGATDIQNEKLYAAIDDWFGTPYYWGGTSKNGVDCSSYVQHIYQKVYEYELPRTSIEQFYLNTKAQFKNQKYLKEGDLIFFRLRYEDKVVSHVGIYLQNGKFTGSNSPHGVQIADLNSDYWQDKYVACARLLNLP